MELEETFTISRVRPTLLPSVKDSEYPYQIIFGYSNKKINI